MGTLKVNHIQPTTGSILTVDSTLVVTGNASIVGDVYVTGTLHAKTTDFIVSANSTVLGDAAGDVVTVTGQLTASRGASIPDDMKLRFGSTPTVGDATIEYDENGTNRLVISGSATGLTLSGAMVQIGALDAGAYVEVTGAMGITGDLLARGAVTLGDATSDDVKITGRIAADIDPKTDNTYDLGGATQQWKDLYVNGIGYIDQLGTDGDPVSVYVNAGEIDGAVVGGESPAAGTFTTLNSNGTTTLGDAGSDVTTVTGRLTGSRGMLIPDNMKVRFGADPGDAYIKYDEQNNDYLVISGSSGATFGGVVISGSHIELKGNNPTLHNYPAVQVTGAMNVQHLTGNYGMSIPDDKKLRFGNAAGGDAHIRYDETANDFLVISGSAKGTALSGSLIKVPDLLVVGKHSNSTSKEAGILVVTADEGDTANGLIATFKSDDSDYCRVNINNSTANADTQFTFMSQESSKWSVGNMGSNETFHIKSGFGEFEDTDPFILTTSDLSINTRLTASRGLIVPDDIQLRFGDATSGDAHIRYAETGSDFLIVSGSSTGLALSGSAITVAAEKALELSGSIVRIPDDTKLSFGRQNDASIEYDENGTDELRFAGAAVTFESDVTFDNDVVLGVAAGDVSTVTGQLTASRGLILPDDMKLRFGNANGGDAHVEYNQTVTDKLIVSGAAGGLALSGSLIQMGARNANSYIQVTGTLATTTDVIIGGDLLPDADDANDLGSTGAAWQDLHLEGDVLMTDAGKLETAAGNLTISSAAADVVIDAEADVQIDAKGGNVEFKDDGTSIITLDMDTVANTAILKHEVDNDAASIQFRQTNDLITAISYDWSGNGAFGAKKPIAIISSALDLSSAANAIQYLGATIMFSTAGSAYAITLPTTADADEAKQLLGWNIRVMLLDPQGTSDEAVTIVRGDTTNDAIFGTAYAADEAAAASNVTVNSNVVTFTSGAPNACFVDITCIAASTSTCQFHAVAFTSS